MKGVRAVDRALDVLLAFIDEPSMEVSELQAATRLSRPTLYRLLHTLERKGFVQSSGEPRRYQIAHRVMRLADSWMAAVDVVQASQPFLQKLWKLSNETVGLHLLQDTRRVSVQMLRSKNPLAYTPGVGSIRPLHQGAPGKAILAFLPSGVVKTVLQEIPARFDRDKVAATLKQVQKDKVCISFGEMAAGGAGIAAPIFDRATMVIGSVSIAAPESRVTGKVQTRYAELVRSTAAGISSALGSIDNAYDR